MAIVTIKIFRCKKNLVFIIPIVFQNFVRKKPWNIKVMVMSIVVKTIWRVSKNRDKKLSGVIKKNQDYLDYFSDKIS